MIVPEFTATIDWGDGSPQSAGAISAGGSAGQLVVSGDHTYAAPGTFDVFVEIDDTSPGTASATVDSTANVAEGIAVHGTLSGATEGTPLNGVSRRSAIRCQASARRTSPPRSTGATARRCAPARSRDSNGSFSVAGSHTYADEAPSVSVVVTVTHTQTSVAGSATMTFSVADADVLSGTPVGIDATPGTPWSGTVARFADAFTGSAASEFTATIDWGDGGAPVVGIVGAGGSAGAFVVTGAHTYAAPGTFDVRVHLAEVTSGGASANVVSAATVAAVPPPPPAPGKGVADVGVRLAGRRASLPARR